MELANRLLWVDGGDGVRVRLHDLLFVFSPKADSLLPFNDVIGVLSKEDVVDEEGAPVHELLKTHHPDIQI